MYDVVNEHNCWAFTFPASPGRAAAKTTLALFILKKKQDLNYATSALLIC
jgi:hypothetical protein